MSETDYKPLNEDNNLKQNEENPTQISNKSQNGKNYETIDDNSYVIDLNNTNKETSTNKINNLISSSENSEILENDKQPKTDLVSISTEFKLNPIPEGYRENRTSFGNYFSKVYPGSIRASVFSLSILSIGTGCLSLPQRVGQMSVLIAVINIIIGAFAANWTLRMMIQASIKSGQMTYSRVIKFYCGDNWAKVLDISMVIYITGILIIYNIIGKLFCH